MQIQRLIHYIGVQLSLFATVASGATIYQTGTSGTHGFDRNDITTEVVKALNVASFNFVGVRFEVPTFATTTRMGGHFVGGFSETSFFGAIVSLTSSIDTPNSDDLSTTDVVGVTKMNFPESSAEVFGDINVSLNPGWYAAVFGTGLFGTTGRGAAIGNAVEFDSPSYLIWQNGAGWFDYAVIAEFLGSGNQYFIVQGEYVPEASSLSLAGAAAGGVVMRRRRN